MYRVSTSVISCRQQELFKNNFEKLAYEIGYNIYPFEIRKNIGSFIHQNIYLYLFPNEAKINYVTGIFLKDHSS